MNTLDKDISDFIKFALYTFPEANYLSSLEKLDEELKELREKLNNPNHDLRWQILDEYIDVMMCIIHSAAAFGFTYNHLCMGFNNKLSINKSRIWKLNDNNTYSHL